jgi:uncharacterized protein YxjI
MMEDRYSHSKYLIRKKFLKLFGEDITVFDPNGNVAFFARLKAFKLKEDIRIYSGTDMQVELLMIKARNIFDISTTYDVIDSSNGQKVGAFRRKGMKSILKDEWVILDINDQEVGMLKEDDVMLALVRRFLTNLVPQEFEGFLGNNHVMHFKQHFNPFIAKIDMDFSMDQGNMLDRRLGIAAGILLTAVEGRQN